MFSATYILYREICLLAKRLELDEKIDTTFMRGSMRSYI